MTSPISTEPYVRRILVIDDTESIHEDFRKILIPSQLDHELNRQAAELFDEPQQDNGTDQPLQGVVIDSALQGQEGCEKVQAALLEGNPYSVAFVDMRMPPGWDGLDTIVHLWEVDPNLQIVICSAYSDYSWKDIVERLGTNDRLLMLKKPFDTAEVCQLAIALSQKWILARQANMKIDEVEMLAESRAKQLLLLSEQTDLIRREKDELKLAVNAMEQVLGVIGHELRTPLAAVRLSAEFLSGQCAGSGQDYSHFATSIQHEAARMATMMDTMLEAARINSGAARWNWGELDIVEVVRDAVNCCTPQFHEKGLPIVAETPDYPIRMLGDREALFRLTTNLLTNACKYSEEGQTMVRVTRERGRAGSDSILLSVKDTGEGIPPEVAEKIGQAFALNRGVVGAAHVKGTGLGLAICSGIAAAHNGTITLKSQVGRGSEFSVRLQADLGEPVAGGGRGIIIGNPA